MKIKLLWVVFVIILLIDIGIGVYIFLPKNLVQNNTTPNANNTKTTTSINTTSSPVTNTPSVKITVTSNDPSIKVVSYDEKVLFDAVSKLDYFENNTNNLHTVIQPTKNNPNMLIVETIKTISFVITSQEPSPITSPASSLSPNSLTYPENYDPTTQTDTITIYLTPDQATNFAGKDLSRIVWQAIVYAVVMHSSQLAKTYTGKPGNQLNNYINTIIDSYTDQIILNKT
jgi:hypothetical protein